MQRTFTEPGTDRARAGAAEPEARGTGWLGFAGFMLALVGIMNAIYGIAAIDSANFYVNNAQFVVSDLSAWGWILLFVGVLQIAASVSVFGRTSWGRWVGIATAGLNAIAQLLFLPASPFLALALFTMDLLIIYGLISYGGRRAAW